MASTPSPASRAQTFTACSRPSGESAGSPWPSTRSNDWPSTAGCDSPWRTRSTSVAPGGGGEAVLAEERGSGTSAERRCRRDRSAATSGRPGASATPGGRRGSDPQDPARSSTLGIVDFRSKKEQIRRAEKAQRKAESRAGRRRGGASRRRQALGGGRGARPVRPSWSRCSRRRWPTSGKVTRRERRRAEAAQALEAIEGLVSSAAPAMEERAKELNRRGRKAAKKAQQAGRGDSEEGPQGSREAGPASPEEGRRGRSERRASSSRSTADAGAHPPAR